MSAKTANILAIGLSESSFNELREVTKNATVKQVQMDVDLICAEDGAGVDLVVAEYTAAIPSIELAQLLRAQFQNGPVFLICSEKSQFERKLLMKNGFSDAFLLPMDLNLFRRTIKEFVSTLGGGVAYRSVKIMDVEPGETLSFDTSVYLPANDKYVKLSNSGDSIDPEKVKKLKSGKLNQVYVPADQMKSFYDHSAKYLQKLNKSPMSETERKEKVAGAVREMLSGLFTEEASSFETGQAVLKDCGEIVKSFISQDDESGWYTRVQSVLGETGDQYSHASNISSLAALFSMGLGIGKPEDLALAGLLHDLGMAELPAEIQNLEEEDMTPAQKELYHKHPQLSHELIQKRKIVVSPIVAKAILQHHELYNGKGFPSGLYGDRICKEAQVLALANRFEGLTRLKPGRPMISAREALDLMSKTQQNDPSKIHFHPELLKQLMTLFMDKN